MQPGKAKSVGALVDAAVRGSLRRTRVLRLCQDNPEVITLALLAAGKRIAELEAGRNGHKGVRRETPQRIDERQTHRLKRCPHCDGRLQRCEHTRTRIIEDIPEEIEPVVTEHTIHRDYCPKCKRHVEPVVPDAMPKATLGHQVIALTSWFHYGLGLTIDQIVDILGFHLQTKLTSGGLVDAWRRLAEPVIT